MRVLSGSGGVCDLVNTEFLSAKSLYLAVDSLKILEYDFAPNILEPAPCSAVFAFIKHLDPDFNLYLAGRCLRHVQPWRKVRFGIKSQKSGMRGRPMYGR